MRRLLHRSSNKVKTSGDVVATFVKDVLRAPLERLPHDTLFRIRFFSWALILGEPAYYLIWVFAAPQPAESLFIRVTSVVVAIPLTLRHTHTAFSRAAIERYWLLQCFYTLPISFFILYALNGFSDVWMASSVAMIYLLFQFTDWRIALLQIVVAAVGVGSASAAGLIPNFGTTSYPSIAHLAIFAFAIATAAGLAVSAANLRLVRLRSSLVTIGVLAHDLRTPIASANLVAEALCDRAEASERILNEAGPRLKRIFRTMNAMIDYQLANARMLDMPNERQVTDMGELVSDAAQTFPFASDAIRHCMEISCGADLHAAVHPQLMRQVVHNLLSNAFRAVAATGRRPQIGDVSIEVLGDGEQIVLRVKDKGIGIAAERIRAIFQPFHSSSAMPLHGLGLAMCRMTATAFDGSISCTSELGAGSCFEFVLPRVTVPGPAPVLAR